mgnify:CR=1 FL=1
MLSDGGEPSFSQQTGHGLTLIETMFDYEQSASAQVFLRAGRELAIAFQSVHRIGQRQ